jgi:hypothetical protein
MVVIVVVSKTLVLSRNSRTAPVVCVVICLTGYYTNGFMKDVTFGVSVLLFAAVGLYGKLRLSSTVFYYVEIYHSAIGA